MDELDIIKIYGLIENDTVVYVGRTKNFTRRLKDHSKTKEFERYEILGRTTDLEEAKMNEDYFIMKFNPKYNKCLNKSGRYINLREKLNEIKVDAANLIMLMQKYSVVPVFAENYDPYMMEIILKESELKVD